MDAVSAAINDLAYQKLRLDTIKFFSIVFTKVIFYYIYAKSEFIKLIFNHFFNSGRRVVYVYVCKYVYICIFIYYVWQNILNQNCEEKKKYIHINVYIYLYILYIYKYFKYIDAQIKFNMAVCQI
jgi:hypothetical protein